MTDREIVVMPDEAAVTAEAAARFVAAVTRAVDERGLATVALSGGSTPLAMFDLLARPPYQTDLPWPSIHLFWADERLVPPDDPGSSFYHAEQRLLAHVPVPPGNIHRIHGEWPAETAAADYSGQLAEFAATSPGEQQDGWPRFDLVLLGLGSDGHTASLFPGSPLTATTPVVAAEADYEGRPARRLSLTPPVINAARQVLFVLTGAAKAEAVAATLGGDADAVRWPAQRIRPASGRVVWLMDEAAASQLR